MTAAGERAPGVWLRLTALTAAAASAAAVVSGLVGLGPAHEVLAALALPPLAALAVAAFTADPRLRIPSTVALAAFAGAALVTGRAPHLALAALAFAASVLAVAATFRGEAVPPAAWRDYLILTKPRIMSLLLLTGAAGAFVGAGGLPPARMLALTLAGLALACGGASALNHVLDADLDRRMRRTGDRPVAAARIPAFRALEFGLALSAFSFVLLASLVNLAAASLALAGNLFYVLVYTRWLKRSTPLNIVIGGAAGAVPPLVGFAAARGDLTLSALFLFAVVFLWTPPHFWSLALLIRRDYEAAGVPMLPVVRGERTTARQILLYSLALAALTLVPFTWSFGPVYLATAAILGGALLWLAARLYREVTPARARVLFHYSLAYLALLFVALAIDPLLS
jgi:protoheme IX farnesyltransferase